MFILDENIHGDFQCEVMDVEEEGNGDGQSEPMVVDREDFGKSKQSFNIHTYIHTYIT